MSFCLEVTNGFCNFTHLKLLNNMKKLIIILVVVMMGCGDNSEGNLNKQRNELLNGGIINGYSISILEIDGCEYLTSGSGYSQMMTHKGNCKNPIHQCTCK